jgi:hypothetical protein
MSKSRSTKRFTLYTLGIFLLLAINAFAGGSYGMAGAKNIPVEWLKGCPSHNYFVPSLILFVCVGGSALLAAILVFRRYRMAREASFSCGVIVLVWIMGPVTIIGYVPWMQPTTAAAAILILFLTWQLL